MLKGKGIISNLQKDIILSLKELPDFENFYLTGGTALAEFYLGHRKSYDLDIFTKEKDLILPFSRLVEEKFSSGNITLKTIRRFSTFVEFELSGKGDKTKLQLAYDSPYYLELPLESELGIKVNSYKEIIVDKLLTFTGRVEPRDAIDLYLIINREELWTLTELASKKDPGFDLYWLAIALQKVKDFPDDIKRWPVEMLVDVDIKDLKEKFSTLAKEIMDKLKNRAS